MKAELQKAESITDVFASLSSQYPHFLEYDIFEQILKQFAANENHEALNYPTHLKNYIKVRKIEDFIEQHIPLHKLDNSSKMISIKFNIESTKSLGALVEVIGNVADALGLNTSTLQLYDVKKGSMVVTLLISTTIADVIFTSKTAFTTEQKDRFQAASVSWFECNGCKFDFSEENKCQGTPSSK